MQLDRLAHLDEESVLGVCERDTAGQVRAPCAATADGGPFDHNRIAGHGVLRFRARASPARWAKSWASSFM